MSSQQTVQPDISAERLAHPHLFILMCAVCLAISIGPIFVSTFSTFVTPLQKEFGWSRGALSGLFTAQGITMVAVTYFVGSLVSNFGARRVIVCSAAFMAAGLIFLAIAPANYWVLVLCCLLIGAAGAGTNTFSYLSVIPQWFDKHLGLLFGLAMTGVGIGQLVMPILAQWITAHYGWRVAYGALATLVFLIPIPLVSLLMRENPRFVRNTIAETSDMPGLSFRDAIRTPAFWLLWTAFFILSVVVSGSLVHLAPLLIDRGIDAATAAKLVGLSGLAVLVFRLAGGYLLDRVGVWFVGTVAFLAAIAAHICLLPQMNPALLFLVPLLQGLVIGMEGDVLPYLSRQFFGMRSYVLVYNRMFLGMMAGGVPGATIMGLLYDYSGGYTLGLWVLNGCALLSMLLFWAGLKMRPRTAQE